MKAAIAAVPIAAAAITAAACTSTTASRTGTPAPAAHKSAAPSGARFAELAAAYRVQTGLSLPPRADALARRICSPGNIAAARISYRLSYQAVRKGNPSKTAYFIVDAIDTYCPGIGGRT